MKKRIVLRMSGGLGNQMFIYGCGYCLSKKYNMNLQVDLTKYLLGTSSSHYQLDDYNISLNKKYPLLFKRRPKTKYEYLLIRKITGLRKNLSFEFVREKAFAKYQKIELNPKRSYYLDGFWQAGDHVIEYREDLKKEFTPKVIRPEVQTRAEEIKKENLCAVHVRRGDYFLYFGGTLSDEYYFEAMDRIRKDNPSVKFLFFSDDIEYCKNAFGKFEDATFIEQGFSGQEEMYLMSKCSEFIIANSSFSWWAAFLSDAKRVIGPVTEMWEEEYYLRGWECIKAKMIAVDERGLRNMRRD